MSTTNTMRSPTARTLADLVRDVAQAQPDKTAILFGDTKVSYQMLETLIERAADALYARGVRKGDRVAVMLPNIPHFTIAYYAIVRLGAIVVPLNVLYKAHEVGYVLRDSEATTMIVFEMFYAQAALALEDVRGVANVIVVAQGEAPAGTIPWRTTPPLIEGDAPAREPVSVEPGDVAVICYTSGTTGKSKGAMLTHRNFIANLEQINRMRNLEIRADDVLLLVLPLFHIFAMNVGMNAVFRMGGAMDLVARFEAAPVLVEIQKNRCSIFLGAPPMFVAWVNLPELGDYDLSSLRIVNSGAAALPVYVLERFGEITGIGIQEGYGLTECAPVTHSNSAAPRIKPGTIGMPIPGVESRVVDEHDRDVPAGQEGEIVVRGENVMAGYWHKPKETDEALRGGWFHTGDIATIDEEGYYTIVDRKKDMINSGGFKVWPREVEEMLYRHPAVAAAAVVATFDPYAGERPMAYIVLKPGQTVTEEDIIAYSRANLASFKAPSKVEFRTELPKLLTGKVLRRALREEAMHANQ